MNKIISSILLIIIGFVLYHFFGQVNGEFSILRLVCVIVMGIILFFIIDYTFYLLKRKRINRIIRRLEDIKDQIPNQKHDHRKKQ